MANKLTDEIRAAIHNQLTAPPGPSNKTNRQRRTSAGLWARPFASDALGVNPDQIEEAREKLRAHGVLAEFDSEGRCIVTSDKQYRDVARAMGAYNGRDGYEIKDDHGKKQLTGRKLEQAKEEFKRQVANGEIDF